MIFNIPFLILCISFTLFHCPHQIKWNDEFLSAQKWKKQKRKSYAIPSKGKAMRSNSKQCDDSTKLNILRINSIFFSKFMLKLDKHIFLLYCNYICIGIAVDVPNKILVRNGFTIVIRYQNYRMHLQIENYVKATYRLFH